MFRLFIAANLPPRLHADVCAAIETLKTEAPPAARFVKPDSLHVTIKFLGNVDEASVPAVASALRDAAASVRKIEVSAEGLTAFPRELRPQVLVLGLADRSGALAALAKDLDRKLEPLGFEMEKRAFRPHVTLARLRAPADVRSLCRTPLACEPARIEEIALYRSHLRGDGPRYEVLECCALSP